MRKVLVVDDSALMRRAISDIIKTVDKNIVVYTADNGLEGLNFIKSNKDVMAVFSDINMPKMSGIELLEAVDRLNIKIPFIMVSSKQEANATMLALDLGCLDFIKKPENIFDTNNEAYIRNIGNALKMAEDITGKEDKGDLKKAPETKSSIPERKLTGKSTAVTTGRASERVSPTKENPPERSVSQVIKPAVKTAKPSVRGKNKLVALVSSTGGPKALQRVIPKLPANFPVPMVMVQHMPAGFTASMAQRLDDMSAVTVKEAVDNEPLRPGTVYISRGGLHMKVASGRIAYDDAPPIVGLKPCGNIMYESLMNSDYDEIVCVVLTGMGADGTKGIKKLAETNNIFVIAQNEASSTVYGMPKAIYDSGLTDCVCDLESIANEIVKKVGV